MRWILFLHGLFIAITFSGQQADSLDHFLSQFDREIAPARWGLVVLRVTDHKTFVSHKAGEYFIPASVVKLLTTAAALHRLGEEYVFRTRFYLQGKKDSNNKVWRGNLMVIGGNDPTLGIKDVDTTGWMDSLAIKLKKLGIDSLTGSVWGISSLFDSIIVPYGYAVDDVGNYFGAGTSSLIWNTNQLRLYFKTGKPGEKATLFYVEPHLPGIKWEVNVVAGKPGSGDRCNIFGYPFEWVRKVEGTLPPYRDTFIVRGSAPDPALFAAFSIQQQLTQKGIRFGSDAKGFYHYRNWQDTLFLFEVISPPLNKMVELTNLFSNNVFAETLLKTLGWVTSGEGTYKGGIEYLLGFLRDTLNISWTGKITDGSGLSRTNQFTPAEMTEFLLAISDKKWFPVFYESLPVAGKSGTLKNYFVSTSLEGNMHAKTGTMSGVRCLAGYFTTSSSVFYAFTLMINDYNKSMATLNKKIEQLLVNIVKTVSKYE